MTSKAERRRAALQAAIQIVSTATKAAIGVVVLLEKLHLLR